MRFAPRQAQDRLIDALRRAGYARYSSQALIKLEKIRREYQGENNDRTLSVSYFLRDGSGGHGGAGTKHEMA